VFRLLLSVHRWLGIAIGLIVALWCLSGFVMMYVQYPELDRGEYFAGLPALDLGGCCIANAEILAQLDGVDDIAIEMLAGLPVLRARFGRDRGLLVNLATGNWFPTINQETAMQQADAFTVAGDFNPFRPLYHFAANDAAGSEIYVSAVSGQVVQATTAHERFWNRLGAVVHWLYPTALRQDAALWSQVVIWLSIASLFLVLVGLYLGIRQYAARGAGSPYAGVTLWHHYAGLAFGLLTLTWLFSGLLSMNPWGALDGDAGAAERQRLAGGTLSSGAITAVVAALGTAELPAGTVQLRSVLLDGKLAMLAADGTGRTVRLDGATLRPAPLAADAWPRIAALAAPGAPVREAGVIETGDDYYFAHYDDVALPAYRLVLDDAAATRLYFDPVSGELLQKFDRDRRWYRWLFLGLHRLDFTAGLRARPLRDLVMLPLLLGVTVGALTGVWLGFRRLGR